MILRSPAGRSGSLLAGVINAYLPSGDPAMPCRVDHRADAGNGALLDQLAKSAFSAPNGPAACPPTAAPSVSRRCLPPTAQTAGVVGTLAKQVYSVYPAGFSAICASRPRQLPGIAVCWGGDVDPVLDATDRRVEPARGVAAGRPTLPTTRRRCPQSAGGLRDRRPGRAVRRKITEANSRSGPNRALTRRQPMRGGRGQR